MIKFLFDNILFFIGHKRPPESGTVNQDYGIRRWIRKKFIYESLIDCQLGFFTRFKNLGHLRDYSASWFFCSFDTFSV